MNRISVLISLYNSSKYFSKTIESVLAQTWKNYEIIIVDDGSTDDSYILAKKYQSDNVKIFKQENKGQCAALNYAISKSSGNYIKFLDADDIISEDHLELQIDRIYGNETYLASCEWGRFYNDDYMSAKFNPELVWQDMKPMDWIKTALVQKSDMMGAWLWLIPKKLLDKAGWWNEKLNLNNDFDFSIRLLLTSEGVKFAKGAKLYYRSGLSNSLSQTFTERTVESAFLTTKLGCENILNRENTIKTRLMCANRYQIWLFRIYPSLPLTLKKFEAEIKHLGGSDIKMDGGTLFLFLQNIAGWKLAKRFQQLLYKFGWKLILKLKYKIKIKRNA